jgi:hypothetical protein
MYYLFSPNKIVKLYQNKVRKWCLKNDFSFATLGNVCPRKHRDFHSFDTNKYLEFLKEEYGSRVHPVQPARFLTDNSEFFFSEAKESENIRKSRLQLNLTFIHVNPNNY